MSIRLFALLSSAEVKVMGRGQCNRQNWHPFEHELCKIWVYPPRYRFDVCPSVFMDNVL